MVSPLQSANGMSSAAVQKLLQTDAARLNEIPLVLAKELLARQLRNSAQRALGLLIVAHLGHQMSSQILKVRIAATHREAVALVLGQVGVRRDLKGRELRLALCVLFRHGI